MNPKQDLAFAELKSHQLNPQGPQPSKRKLPIHSRIDQLLMHIILAHSLIFLVGLQVSILDYLTLNNLPNLCPTCILTIILFFFLFLLIIFVQNPQYTTMFMRRYSKTLLARSRPEKFTNYIKIQKNNNYYIHFCLSCCVINKTI